MGRPTEEILDELLVMDAQDGKVKALEILVSRWQRRLWHYAHGLTGNLAGHHQRLEKIARSCMLQGLGIQNNNEQIN